MKRDKRQSIAVTLLAGFLALALRAAGSADPLSGVVNSALRPLAEAGRSLSFSGPDSATERRDFSASVAELEAENNKLRQQLGLKPKAGFQTVRAEVIGKSVQPYLQRLRLNVGRNAGVLSDMPVLESGRLIGRIRSADSGSSEVILLADPDFRAAGVVAGTEAEGMVRTVAGALVIDSLNRTGDELGGKTVLTSGLGGIFPPGLALGTVGEQVSAESDIFAQYGLENDQRYGDTRFVEVVTKVGR